MNSAASGEFLHRKNMKIRGGRKQTARPCEEPAGSGAWSFDVGLYGELKLGGLHAEDGQPNRPSVWAGYWA